MRIIKCSLDSSNQIVNIHLQAFPEFFLTSLGKRFLKTYYKSVIADQTGISLGLINDKNEFVGFSVGTNISKGFHKRLVKKNILPFLVQGLIILFINPKSILRLIKNFDKGNNKDDDGNYAELLSIAVSPEAKGAGIGKEMIAQFEAEAKAKGCIKVALTTDYFNNDDVIAFYKKSGYEVFYEFTTYPKRRMYKLIKNLV